MTREGWAINMKQTTKTTKRQQQQNEQLCVVTILGMGNQYIKSTTKTNLQQQQFL